MPDHKTIAGVKYKRCCNSDCRAWYPATREHFHGNKSRPDGLTAACKYCRNKLARERWDIKNEPQRTLIKIDVKKVLAATRKKDKRGIQSKRLASVDCDFNCPICGMGHHSNSAALKCCDGRVEHTLPAQNLPIPSDYQRTYRINLKGGRQ